VWKRPALREQEQIHCAFSRFAHDQVRMLKADEFFHGEGVRNFFHVNNDCAVRHGAI
jgi:hypothetical protein